MQFISTRQCYRGRGVGRGRPVGRGLALVVQAHRSAERTNRHCYRDRSSGCKEGSQVAVAFVGIAMVKYLAMIAAWAGEKDLACEQLAIATSKPGDLSYGQLKLMPFWDPLRGDPRFEKIVASLAPKQAAR